MSKTVTTTVRGERRIGERCGHASLILGLLALTFMEAQSALFGLDRRTLTAAIAGFVILLGLVSRSQGHRTGGSTGIVLGLAILYLQFIAPHVSRLASHARVGEHALVPYVLIVMSAVALLYVLYRPKRSVHERSSVDDD